jgi:hypothetical protein
MAPKMSSAQGERYFTPKRFLELLEKEREWFEMLMYVGLLPGTPSRAQKVMLVERTRWLRN